MALTFDYKVRDKSGGLVEGQLDGDSMALVVRRLREMGYMPISVTPKSAVSLKTEIKIPGISDRIKLREVAVMTRQLSTMVDSGLSVVRSLGILAAQVENPALAKVLDEVRLDLEHGSSLSAACAKHPKVFSKLFCTLVQAGEVGGNLDEVLGSLADTIEKQAQLNQTIRSAMTYPAVVLSVMVVIFTAMIVFIVPVFQNLFKTLGGKLPLPDPDPDQDLEHHDQCLGAADHRRRHRRHHRHAEVDRHRGGPAHLGPVDAQAAGLRSAVPQGRPGPDDQHTGVADRLGCPDPRVPRHLCRHVGEPHRRRRAAGGEGGGARGTAPGRSAPGARGRHSRRWWSR